MMRILTFALVLLGAMGLPVVAQTTFPALYDVTGVAADDVLNIRAEASGSSEVVGSLGSNQQEVEVVAADGSGKWLQVNTQERSGWVAARFMKARETGDYLLGRSVNCFGTEPFWSLDMIQGARATLSRQDADPLSFPAGLMSRGAGRTDRMIV
ncbi:MAG: SH3 domain-containing protein, partial [Paracoccaceae bacterium]